NILAGPVDHPEGEFVALARAKFSAVYLPGRGQEPVSQNVRHHLVPGAETGLCGPGATCREDSGNNKDAEEPASAMVEAIAALSRLCAVFVGVALVAHGPITQLDFAAARPFAAGPLTQRLARPPHPGPSRPPSAAEAQRR